MENGSRLRELYEARRLDEAWAEYARMLSNEPDGVTAHDHWYGALTARMSGDFRECRWALERAEFCSPTGEVKGRVILSMGCVLREIGDTSAAIEYLLRFLAGLDEYRSLIPVAEGYAWYNLGLTYRCARRLPDAIEAYQRAAERFRADDMPRMLCTTLHNLSWVYCLTGDTLAAETSLTEAQGLSNTEEDHWNQRIGRAFLEYVAGERTSALRLCEWIIAEEEKAPPDIVSHAYWVAGKIAVALGQIENAMLMANQAIAWSLKVKDDIRPMQDANALRKEIYIQSQNQNSGA